MFQDEENKISTVNSVSLAPSTMTRSKVDTFFSSSLANKKNEENKQTNKQTKKQTNKHFFIDNISAKSSPKFKKIDGNIPGGILRGFK